MNPFCSGARSYSRVLAREAGPFFPRSIASLAGGRSAHCDGSVTIGPVLHAESAIITIASTANRGWAVRPEHKPNAGRDAAMAAFTRLSPG